MPKTNTFVVDNIGAPEPVTADIPCSFILIYEPDATQVYLVHEPSATDTPVKRINGTSYLFEAHDGTLFQTGQIVGYAETTAGTITMHKRCY